jgi:hypothetical protein
MRRVKNEYSEKDYVIFLKGFFIGLSRWSTLNIKIWWGIWRTSIFCGLGRVWVREGRGLKKST